MKPPPKVLYLNRCPECGDREVWCVLSTRTASNIHRRNHRRIYGKKHVVKVMPYALAPMHRAGDKPEGAP